MTPGFTRDKDGLPVRSDGFIHEEQYQKDLEEGIKRICQFAGYLHEEGVSVPECKRGDRPCPRPETCEDSKPRCQGIKEYSPQCGKFPGKPCPKNICPIRMRDQMVEENKRRMNL